MSAEQYERVQMGQRLNVFEQLTDDLQSYIASAIEQKSSTDESNDEQRNINKNESNKEIPLLHEIAVDICLINEQGQFIGLGAVSLNGRLQPKKLIQL